MERRVFQFIWCIVFTIFSNGTLAGGVDPALLAKLQEVKTLAESEAQLVKQRMPPESHEFLDAQRAYNFARSKYSGLISATAQAIRTNSVGKFQNSKTTKRLVAEAQEAIKEYFKTTDRILGRAQTKSGPALLATLTGLISLALEALKGVEAGVEIGQKLKAQRDAEADRFENKLEWLSWQDI